MKILNIFYSTVMSSYKPKEEIDMVCFLVDKFNIPIEDIPLGFDEIEKMYKKYEQLVALGFTNVYVYVGGMFEWLLLQDIYGSELFPTTSEELDILKYKSQRIFDVKYISNG